ncbi:MAG: glycosyltransferase [Gemmatimonadetes bacterium]|nr:glycosyltransferase [Gemmatimonadota bacterium]
MIRAAEPTRHAVIVAFWAVLTPRQILFLQTLKEEGWRITVLAWDREGSGKGPVLPEGLVDEVRLISLPAPAWSLRLLARLPRYYARLLREVERIPGRPMWILTHFLHLPIARFLRGRVLYDAAEMYAVDMGFYAGPLRRVATSMLDRIELLLVRGVDGITTVDSLNGWLETRYRGIGKPVQVLWNLPARSDDVVPGRNRTLDLTGSSGASAGSGAQESRKLVAYAGGLMKEKGFRVILEAAARVLEVCPDTQFVFYGRLKDDEAAVSRLLDQLGLGEAVRFFSHVPYPELLVELQKCSVGLAPYQPVYHYPLVSSGNARKIFSYMQAGIPVVAPDFGEIGNVVREVECGHLVDTEDPEALADAVIDLLVHAEQAHAMGERGRRAFETRFSWEEERSKLMGLVDSLAKNGKAAGE